jgi:hypothetical protein
MAIRERGAFTTTLGSATVTLGNATSGISFVGIAVAGSAALGSVTILDGTKTCFVINVASATGWNSYSPTFPVVFNSALITTVVSTANYSITYLPMNQPLAKMNRDLPMPQ